MSGNMALVLVFGEMKRLRTVSVGVCRFPFDILIFAVSQNTFANYANRIYMRRSSGSSVKGRNKGSSTGSMFVSLLIRPLLLFRLGFAVPTPSDLKHYYYNSDRNKPSQSKRWTDPSVIKDESTSPPRPATTVAAPQSKPNSASRAASSRSHKAKAHSPVVDSRRSVGAGHRALSGVSDKSHNDFKAPGGTSVRPGGTSTRRFSNTSSSDSPTSANGAATGTGKGKEVPLGPVKKRSTMNSRDAAYEEAIAASLREAANGGSGSAGESGATGTRSRRGVTESQEYAQEEEEAAKKGKKSNSSSASAVAQGAARGIKRSRQEEEEVDETGDDMYVAGGGRKGKKKKDDEGKSVPVILMLLLTYLIP